MHTSWKRDLIMLAACGLLYAGIQSLIEYELLNDYLQNNLIMICIYIILAVSLNLINGFTGQFSIGHAGFMAVGAYVSAVLTVKLHLSFAAALLSGAAAAGVLGFLIGLPTLRLSGDYLAIATLGLGEIIRVVILNIPYIGGASGFMGIPLYTNFTIAFFVMVMSVYLIKNFVNSAHGRACVSIREDEIAAEFMGINTTKYKVSAFAMGAFFAGVAGALFSHYITIATPNSFNFMKSFEILTIVVLGGLGSLTGSIASAIFLVFISAALADWPAWRMVIYSLTLILLMIFRPQGLFGNRELSLRIFDKLLGGAKRERAAKGE